MSEEKNIENATVKQIGVRVSEALNLIEIGIFCDDKTINLRLTLEAVKDLNRAFYRATDELQEILNKKNIEEIKELDAKESEVAEENKVEIE